ncbi:MAG TPA: pyridoxamine 5'-phosphate oxidase family protein [Acidimicrobiales bacterium]|jgi:PPOX class probable F420-dependent enzyme|nr:pyridoxamine 5'-phosphate oxidase family protein [Acidimicrobiales bacterium]
MFDEQRAVTLASMNPDGSIHAVAMFAVAHEERVVFLTKERAQKVRNIERDPRVTVAASTPDGGIQIRGHAEIVDDPVRLEPLARRFLARRAGPPATEADMARALHRRVAISVTPLRTLTWSRWVC